MMKRRLCFLVRSHTKNDCDRMFNAMKRSYRKTNVHTPNKEMIEALNQDAGVNAAMVEGPFKDWSKLQTKYMKKVKGGMINPNHVFTVRSNMPNKIIIQEYWDATCKHQFVRFTLTG